MFPLRFSLICFYFSPICQSNFNGGGVRFASVQEVWYWGSGCCRQKLHPVNQGLQLKHSLGELLSQLRAAEILLEQRAQHPHVRQTRDPLFQPRQLSCLRTERRREQREGDVPGHGPVQHHQLCHELKLSAECSRTRLQRHFLHGLIYLRIQQINSILIACAEGYDVMCGDAVLVPQLVRVDHGTTHLWSSPNKHNVRFKSFTGQELQVCEQRWAVCTVQSLESVAHLCIRQSLHNACEVRCELLRLNVGILTRFYARHLICSDITIIIHVRDDEDIT